MGRTRKQFLITAGIIAAVLIAAVLLWKVIPSIRERRAGSNAWMSVIEKRYRMQIERLRDAAFTATNSDDRLPEAVVRAPEASEFERIQPVREDDWRLFGAPEILEAKIQFEPRGWNILSKKRFSFSRGWGGGHEPRIGFPVLNRIRYEDENKNLIDTVEYQGMIRNQKRQLRKYSLLLDLSKLPDAAADVERMMRQTP
jgi:hypothetical protein